jgi:protein O-mannosyl-transferase
MSANSKRSNITPPLKPGAAKATLKKNDSITVPSWTIAIVLICTAIIYSRALDNGFTYMDDDYYIINNYYLRDFSLKGIWAIFTHFYSFNYHPLTSISNLIEYTLFKLNPLPYHLVNVALHLLNTWLAYRLAEGLSGKRITALVVAILFAIHPMHVESVAWAAERKDVLYAAFYLSSLLLYLRYVRSGLTSKYYIASLVLFLASLLSKSAAVTLPVLLVAVDLYKGRKIDTKSIAEKIPFLLLSILFGVLAIMSQNAGGAVSDLSRFYSPVARIFLFTAELSSYLLRFIAPLHLSALHYFPDTHGGPLPWYYYLSLSFVALLAWLATRRSGYRKEILFGLSFFLITISVMLQVIAVGSSLIAERYTYISYIGLFYVAGQFVAGIWETKYKGVAIAIMGIYAIVFSVVSWNRIGIWKDSDVLFSDVTGKEPDNWRNCFVYYYWGISKSSQGKDQEALEEYTKAIQLKPDFDRAYVSRGQVYDMLHNPKAAIADYNKAISLNPRKAEIYNGRGWAFYELGDKDAAMKDYEKAIALNPTYADAYNNRGWANYEAGNDKSALADFSKAISLNPSFTKPYFNRASIEVNTHDLKGALADYNYLISLDPNDNNAYYSRGIVRFNMGDRLACDDWAKAVELGNPDALKLLNEKCK